MDELNVYGDTYRATSGTHGADIASQRIDELDQMALRRVAQMGVGTKVLDIGCGHGVQSLRFALLGASVTAVDIIDAGEKVSNACKLLEMKDGAVTFHHKDVREFVKECDGEFDIIYSQRFIHYLPYDDACCMMRALCGFMRKGSYFYLSASGMTTELAQGYDAGSSIKSRFSLLEHDMGIKHGILEPVCLYYKDEMQAMMEEVGFTTEKVWTSTFGNVKGVFYK